ncbi:MAG: hypothetical protein KJZ86_13325 [Caldilineaceae bacterium]|nr:hypothetical protein [Caldilineaceae bacterium]
MTRLTAYLDRLEDTLRSRHELTILSLRYRQMSGKGNFRAHVRFYNESELIIREEIEESYHQEIERIKYVFQYQGEDGTLIFRYDNAPHFPDLPTFPSHKHTPDGVIAADTPDLTDVLQEIDAILYP